MRNPNDDLGKITVAAPTLRMLHTPEQVLQAIRQRQSEGLPLNHAAVLRQDGALHRAILKHFGRWDAALRAAGIDPELIRCHRHWGRQAIIRHLLQLEAQGQPLNVASVEKDDKGFPAAARHWFGSWASALKAAGIAPARWTKRVPRWTHDRVIQTIQAIYARGGAVNHAAVRRNSVSRAGVALFGSWDNALRAAGLDPATVRRWHKPWTPDTLLQEIRRKAQVGEPLNAKDVSPKGLRKRARAFFGSWDATLAAAGLDPATIRKNRWRRDRRG